MIQFKYECYAGVISTDDRSSSTFAHFISMSDALEAGKGKGWYGSDGTAVKESINIKIFENLDEYNGNTLASQRERALSKLTEKEKQLLGL